MVCKICALAYKNHSIWKFFNCFTVKPIWPVNIYSAYSSLSSVCYIPLVALSQEVASITQWKTTVWDLRLPHQQDIVSNVLEECDASLFREKHCSLTAWPWRWKDYAPPKCWQLHSNKYNEKSQKTWIFEVHTVCICCCLKPRWGFFLSYCELGTSFYMRTDFWHRITPQTAFCLLFCMRKCLFFYQCTQHKFLYAYWLLSLYHIGKFLPPSLAYQLVSIQLLH